jgi:DNA polymerase-3 subunit delta
VAADALKPVYVVTGTDRPKIRRAIQRLRSRFPDESVELLDAEGTSGGDAASACNALGLFGAEGGKLVVVEGVERWRKDDADAIAAYVRDPVPGSVLALVATGPLKSEGLARAVAPAGELLQYDVPKPKEPVAWVRSEFKRLGTPLDADAARALVGIVGDDASTLASEIEKLATWARGEPVGRRDVEALAAPTNETAVWALTDAWGERDSAAVLAACESLLERRTREPFGVAAALAAYVARVHAAQALSGEGLSTAEVARRLGVREYPARKALAHAENYSREELDAVVVRLAELDEALKGGSRLASELELERALVDVTANPQRETATA